MTFKINFTALLLLLSFSSCQKEIIQNTTKKETTEELKKKTLKEIFSNSNYSVYMSSYISLEKDGISDIFLIYIENKTNNTAFSSSKKQLAFEVGDETTENPESFLKEASLHFYLGDNNYMYLCNNIYNLTFEYPIDMEITEYTKIWNVDINLTLSDNTKITKTESFKIVDYENWTHPRLKHRQ